VVKRKTDNQIQIEASNRPRPTHPDLHTHNNNQTGILIVGHGSRRAEANADVRQAARSIGERGGFALVQPAFLEIEHPRVAEGFTRLVAQGAREVIVHPYFLSPGRHTRGDLPREVSEVAARHSDVGYHITKPLSAHPLVIEASIERIREGKITSPRDRHIAERGRVYLVGGGPGDVGLLTLRACELLSSCDVVLHDYLVDAGVLQLVTNNVERIAVGKIGGGACTPQAEINRLLVEKARAGKRIVRLKGGDPFLFGRGGEECAGETVLRQRGRRAVDHVVGRAGEVPGRRDAEVGQGDQGRRHRSRITGNRPGRAPGESGSGSGFPVRDRASARYREPPINSALTLISISSTA